MQRLKRLQSVTRTLNRGEKRKAMKAIVTKYHGPTNFKGSRITASDEDGNRITISYPHELSGEACHRKAAQALCNKMKWEGNLIAGSLKHGYVFVFGPDLNTELLEACKRIVYEGFCPKCGCNECNTEGCDGCEMVTQCRAAIAKAEGK
jgi:hypothetical protein